MTDKKYQQFYILEEEYSNRALVRDVGEKWPDDVNGEPSGKWQCVIDIQAVKDLESELEAATKKNLTAVKAIFDLTKELNETQAELERVKAELSDKGDCLKILSTYSKERDRASWMDEKLKETQALCEELAGALRVGISRTFDEKHPFTYASPEEIKNKMRQALKKYEEGK